MAAQPTPTRRALFAMLYGGAIEVGTVLRLTRADVWADRREVRAPGTKTHTRDHVAAISDWAWPMIWEHVRTILPSGRLFPAFRVEVVWHWHRETCEALELAECLLVHAARYHWAVLALRANTPVRIVLIQLGHSTPMLTLATYGAFVPSADDRDHWREHVAAAEQNGGRPVEGDFFRQAWCKR